MAAPEIMSVGFRQFLFSEMFSISYLYMPKQLSNGIRGPYHTPLSGILTAVMLGTYMVKQC